MNAVSPGLSLVWPMSLGEAEWRLRGATTGAEVAAIHAKIPLSQIAHVDEIGEEAAGEGYVDVVLKMIECRGKDNRLFNIALAAAAGNGQGDTVIKLLVQLPIHGGTFTWATPLPEFLLPAIADCCHEERPFAAKDLLSFGEWAADEGERLGYKMLRGLLEQPPLSVWEMLAERKESQFAIPEAFVQCASQIISATENRDALCAIMTIRDNPMSPGEAKERLLRATSCTDVAYVHLRFPLSQLDSMDEIIQTKMRKGPSDVVRKIIELSSVVP